MELDWKKVMVFNDITIFLHKIKCVVAQMILIDSHNIWFYAGQIKVKNTATI